MKKVFKKGNSYTYEEIEEILTNAIEPVMKEITNKMTKGKKPKGDMEQLRLSMEELRTLCELTLFQMYVLGEDIKTKNKKVF